MNITNGTLEIYIENGVWMVHHGGQVGREVMDLFGTTEIPSPFTKSTSAAQVITELADKNQDCEVKLRGVNA